MTLYEGYSIDYLSFSTWHFPSTLLGGFLTTLACICATMFFHALLGCEQKPHQWSSGVFSNLQKSLKTLLLYRATRSALIYKEVDFRSFLAAKQTSVIDWCQYLAYITCWNGTI